MARNNKGKIVKNIKPSEISKVIKSVDDAQKDSSVSLYGFNRNISDKNKIDFDNIKSKLRDINDKYKETTGENVIEFFTKLSLEENRINRKKIKGDNSANLINDISKSFNSPNNTFLSQLYVEEKERLNKYKEYEFIVKLIPQINQIVDIIADSIISPDDYSKQIFTLKYNGTTTSTLTSEKNIFDNLKTVEKRYKIENKAKTIIRDTLVCGDQFYTNIPLKREFQKMLTEDYNPFLSETVEMLNEDQVLLSEIEEHELNKFIINRDKKDINWRTDITKAINENIEIVTKPLGIYKNELEILVEDTEVITQSFTTVDMSTNGVISNGTTKNKMKTISNIDIDGSYVKKLDPSKVVKLSVGSSNFGYYYIESDTLENIIKPVSNNNLTKVIMGNNVDIAMEGVERQDPKISLVSSIVGRNLSKKLGKKFLEKNKEFKKIIYELVREEYIIEKKVRIVYFAPDEVTHFRINEQENGYGTSLLEPILFTAKLYLASLTTTLMLKLTRSADHRTFYVETGLSNDVEEAVQGIIRDVKTKEISLSDLQSVDTIFNNIGQFHDYCATRYCETSNI